MTNLIRCRIGWSIRVAIAALAFAYAIAFCVARADAIPVFAHRYGVQCQACHTEVPHLNDFGARFRANGYRIDGLTTRGAWPLAIKMQLAYSSDVDPTHLPKAIVDEIELLTGGSLGSRTSYFAETYLVDGGRPGAVRDAWAAYHIGSYVWPLTSATLTAGQFTLPLPIDPETFRETQAHYAIWDQVISRNPFNFFDPHQGAALEFGSGSATTFTLAALAGHDKLSGIAAYGTDRMAILQHAAGPLVASVYRYDGSRKLDSAIDRFWRQGYGLGLRLAAFELNAVYQDGFDTDADGFGRALRSGGGFVQARYTLTARDFALARYDGTQDTNGLYRAVVIGGGHRFGHNARLTVEDVITHTPVVRHSLNTTLLLAY